MLQILNFLFVFRPPTTDDVNGNADREEVFTPSVEEVAKQE